MNPNTVADDRSDTGVGISCHGTLKCLESSSAVWRMSPVMRFYQRFASYLTWWLENLGWRRALTQVVVDNLGRVSAGAEGRGAPTIRTGENQEAEALGLQPGELVEVRPIDEILATLSRKRRCKGLLWMTGMRKFCGKRYRVLRRVERIMLETNGELRTMKNTVLLEGVMCDGTAFGGCDRSCFHFWREAWLRRVPAEEHSEGGEIHFTEEDPIRSRMNRST